VPDALVMRQVAHRIEHARESVRQQGIDPERMPWDYQKLIAELRPGAEKAVRRALLLEAIADKEAIAPTDADVDAEVEKLAQASQRPTPAVRRMMEKSGDLEGLRQGLRDRMTLELLVASANLKA
jgi:trigger factor